MADQKIIDQAERVLYKTYNRYPVVFDHGKGVTLYDSEGNAYLDFGAGIAVMGLGYGDEAFNQAVKAQVDQLTHIDVYKRQGLHGQKQHDEGCAHIIEQSAQIQDMVVYHRVEHIRQHDLADVYKRQALHAVKMLRGRADTL